ncbi:MAG: ABC transporter substrate-binding protein [Lachnospiraceae bacterium]|nr:ABC transporter substrate-binding protein [Lachnospiraceae bacterium]
MKKLIALLIAAVMILSMLSACGTTPAGTDTPKDTAEAEAEAEPEAEAGEEAGEEEAEASPEGGAVLPDELTLGSYIKGDPSLYPNVDFSKEETIYICLIGDTPNDFQDILDKANEYLAPYNTKLDFTIWAWSDYQDLYSLNLASGANIDIIFTAPWSYLWSEASNGSFMALSDDFITNNMPLTRKYQIPETWNGVKLAGDIIAVPQNTTNPNGKIVAIRQDLADKYGIGELKSWEDYKNYLLTIAEKETPDSGIFAEAASSSNAELWDVFRQQYDTMVAASTQDYISYLFTYEKGVIPTKDDLVFTWTSDWFKEFCKDMNELANAGAWSRSALTNEVSAADAFGALQGASFAWNLTVFNYINQAEAASEDVKCAAYDITMNNFAIGEAYNNNDMAITASTSDPERAAMVLDLIKMDTYLNHLFRMGIEGVHYEIDDDNNYVALDKAGDYAKDSISMSWAIKNGDIKEYIPDERKKAVSEAEEAKMAANPLEGFVFDDANIQAEAAAVNAILKEYIPSLQLGLYDDYEAKIDEMMAACKDAGFDKIEEEIFSQYEAWYNSMN